MATTEELADLCVRFNQCMTDEVERCMRMRIRKILAEHLDVQATVIEAVGSDESLEAIGKIWRAMPPGAELNPMIDRFVEGATRQIEEAVGQVVNQE